MDDQELENTIMDMLIIVVLLLAFVVLATAWTA